MFNLTGVEQITYDDLTYLLQWRTRGRTYLAEALVIQEETGQTVGRVRQMNSGRWFAYPLKGSAVFIETYGHLRDTLEG